MQSKPLSSQLVDQKCYSSRHIEMTTRQTQPPLPIYVCSSLPPILSYTRHRHRHKRTYHPSLCPHARGLGAIGLDDSQSTPNNRMYASWQVKVYLSISLWPHRESKETSLEVAMTNEFDMTDATQFNDDSVVVWAAITKSSRELLWNRAPISAAASAYTCTHSGAWGNIKDNCTRHLSGTPRIRKISLKQSIENIMEQQEQVESE